MACTNPVNAETMYMGAFYYTHLVCDVYGILLQDIDVWRKRELDLAHYHARYTPRVPQAHNRLQSEAWRLLFATEVYLQ